MKTISKYWMLALLVPTGMKAYEPPTMGWSSWNTYGFRINEALIKTQTDAMVEKGLKDAGYMYINIDDGFFGGRDEEGNLLIHPTRFPNGLRTVVDYIHGKGLKAGIYSDAGKNTCASYHGGDTAGIGVGLYEHDQQDIDLYFKELNFDFIKVDFCGGDPIHNVDKLDLPEQDRYTAIYNAIRNTGRKDVRLNVCRWAFPGTWVHEVATSWRVSEDIYLGWESVKGIIGQSLYLSAFATEGKFNDMDMLEVGRGLTEEEDKTHFGMWCIMSSPLLIGCDMTTIPQKTLDLLKNKELIALNQDPLALQAYVVKKESGAYVLVKDVETLYGTRRAVAFYNPTDTEQTMTVDFLELDLGGKVRVRDLYARQDLGEWGGTLQVKVPAHGTRIYKLEAEKRYERTVYEGETAWLDAYQELSNNQAEETGIYEEASYCSGGAKAGWLGKSEKNDLQWRNVYSAEGGEYSLKLSYICGEKRNVSVSVNGAEPVVLSLNSGGWSKVGESEIKVTLNRGTNVIRLFNATAWMPDIDCMTLVKTNSLDVYQHKLESLVQKAGLLETNSVPNKIQSVLADALQQAGEVEESEESYLSAIENLQTALQTAESSRSLYAEFIEVMKTGRDNAANSVLTTALTNYQNALDEAEKQIQTVSTQDEVRKELADLKKTASDYVKNKDARPEQKKSWNMSVVMTNPTFDVNASGWTGTPTVKYGVAEHYNKNFDTYQNLTGLKNGRYTVKVCALYRTGENDGGKAYREGTEVIPAQFYANMQKKPVQSLYAYEYGEATEGMGNLDLKNGYVNSMYAAETCFAQGRYVNMLEVTVTNGRLKVGLSSSGQKWDCWCCFDNFELTYWGEEEDAIKPVMESHKLVNVYSIDGVLLKNKVTEQEALQGLSEGTYIVDGKKIWLPKK